MGKERAKEHSPTQPLSPTGFYTLLLLSKEDCNGYNILRKTKKLFGVEFVAPTVYATIEKLSSDELIRKHASSTSRGWVLSITDEGRERLGEEIERMTEAIDHFNSQIEPKKF